MKFTVSFAMFALPLLATASPLVGSATPATYCNTGSLQCCNTIEDAHDPKVASLLGGLDLSLEKIVGPIGLNCNPIVTVIGGTNTCSQQTVCCTGNTFNSLVTVGCSPLLL